MLFETVPYLISGVPLKFSAPAVPIAETRQVILTCVLRTIMKIINSKYTAAVITSQETSLDSLFNLVIDTIAFKPFLVGGVVVTNSIITPSYSEALGFIWRISLTEAP